MQQRAEGRGEGIRDSANRVTKKDLSGYAPREPAGVARVSDVRVDAVRHKRVRVLLLLGNHICRVNVPCVSRLSVEG